MIQTRKKWSKPDQIYIHDKKEEGAPEDTFKMNRTVSAKKKTDDQMNWDKPMAKPEPDPVESLKKAARKAAPSGKTRPATANRFTGFHH